MSTYDIQETSEFTKAHKPSARDAAFPRRVGRLLLTSVLLLLSLVAAIPVILLFIVTSVPTSLALVLTLLDLGIVVALFHFGRTPLKLLGTLAALIFVSALAVYASQVFASTPPVANPGGIASLEQVELNGSQQWITIRGNDVHNPVLLFLAGGPGGSELVMTRRYLGALEDHFVVVNWDQAGTGKSYNAVAMSSLTPEGYVSDAYALTRYLSERFDQEKIYVLGGPGAASWASGWCSSIRTSSTPLLAPGRWSMPWRRMSWVMNSLFSSAPSRVAWKMSNNCAATVRPVCQP